MRTIRASEINTYLFCQRAWHYALNGEESENQAEFAGGNELHYRHSRAAMGVGRMRTIAYVFLVLAVVLLTIYLASMLR